VNTEAPRSAGRRLTLSIAGQRYVVSGQNVVEVLRRPEVTRVPHGLLGVSNLRGAVLPVVSLARLMGAEPGGEDRVVVLDHAGAVGLLVDAVLGLDLDDEASGSRQIDVAALLEAGFKRQNSRPAAGRDLRDVAASAAGTRVAQRVLITFLVGGQVFALPVDAVIVVLRQPKALSRVAGADAAVLGVADVRDHTLPILSLAALLGFSAASESADGRVLVVEHAGAQIGLAVDAIETITRLDETAIDAVPPILQRGRGQAELDGIGRQGGSRSLLSILSVPRLFANATVEATVAATSTEAASMAEPGAPRAREQFVVFDLGDERYGLPIHAVQEVLRLPDTVTRLPNGPRFVTGIINLRGRPVPIIDQRQRFDAPVAADSVQPRVIIVTVGGVQAGLVVDAVSEILSLAADTLTPAPALSSERSAVFSRVANLEGRLILLIDPEELLSRAEQDVIADIAARPDPAGQP